MASKELPTILLIPGAFTTPACYDWLAPYLEKAGYPISRATLLSTNPPDDPSTYTAEREGLNLLDKYLLPLIESGKDVVVFAHSFGATSCSGASKHLSKKSRESKGLKGGVLGLVYIATCFPQEGTSQFALLGSPMPPFCKPDFPQPGFLVFDPAIDTLYHDVSDASLQKTLGEGHLPQAIACFETPIKDPLWSDPELDGRRVYLLTKEDKVFPPEAQPVLVKGSGVEWDVKEIEGGHCAFIQEAEAVAKATIESIEKWL
ncbi:hypothetical protein M409DRAFT_23843 [Zasmidium cellare ATCC 36951]|uniref:AB hydrolase-1 domain-containing protein n=1 Tax=Zasmidium cellare ATCC 36951 TaxID=1080233 RepID=A0A6A6CG38_ZASCE|nr:uncharacterized protein M409DRAFT_23843 [Zasmidium cellare ATCC 36951]KAF2166115.1 hypothetical protein M409DRAFT_23843 [Zasmidium cellare ATCC 36951]